jgi:hypothetical protein
MATSPHPDLRVLNTVDDLDRWLLHVKKRRADRHLLILGPPGKGKTLRLMHHFRPMTAADHPKCRHIPDRLPVPYYHGRMTPGKWYIRGWQHQDDPLLILNDLHIRSTDADWEAMLCQFLEVKGEREIRWDLRSEIRLTAADRDEIRQWLDEHGPPRNLRRPDEEEDEDSDRWDPLPQLALWDERDDQKKKSPAWVVPSHCRTASQVLLVANQLGRGWDRILSRLRGFWYDPSVESLLEDMARWDPPVPRIILEVLQNWHRHGEILDLDLRRVDDAIEDLQLGEDWESPLARSLQAAAHEELQQDAQTILNWLTDVYKARVGQDFTESQLYHACQQFRPDKGSGRGNLRRHRALEYLIVEGFLERWSPARRLGVLHGRPPGRGFRIVKLPGHENTLDTLDTK